MTVSLEVKGRGSDKKQVPGVKKVVSGLLKQVGLSGEFHLTMTGKTHGSVGEEKVVLVRREKSAVKIRVQADPRSHFQCFLNGGGLSPRQLWSSLSTIAPTTVGKNGGAVIPKDSDDEKTEDSKRVVETSSVKTQSTDTTQKEKGMGNKMRGFTSRPEEVELAMLAIDEHLKENKLSRLSYFELRNLLADLFEVQSDGRIFNSIFKSLCAQGHLILVEEGAEKFYSRPASKEPSSESSGLASDTFEKFQALHQKVARYEELTKQREVLVAELEALDAEIARDGLDQAATRLEEIEKLL